MTETSAPSVLIVDDNPKNVKLLEAHLAGEGYLTSSAFDGQGALDALEAARPDLVLLDVMMPVLDGFEVCRRIKNDAETRHIPVVMVTALDRIEDKVRGIEAGADDFLTKPVNRLELLARTRHLIKTKRLNEQVLSLQRVLTRLFEITTFSDSYAERRVLLAEFSRHAAELSGASSVAITFRHGSDDYQVEGGFNLNGEMERQRQLGAASAVAQVLRGGETLAVSQDDTERLGAFGLSAGYLGVPLKSFGGHVIGAMHAFGLRGTPGAEPAHLLMVVAQRLSYELQLKDYNQQLEDAITQRTADLKQALGDLRVLNESLLSAQSETIFRLAKAAEYRDEDTAEHLYRISGYVQVIGRRLGLEADHIDSLALASIMHDVGKIGTPDAILLKRGALTPEEYQKMKEHTLIGARILGESNSDVLRLSERIAISHHEKYDGSGYPYGLRGEQIPLEARIVAIADVFDALTTERVYKRAFSVEEALNVLRDNNGTHFDPRVLQAFFDGLDEVLAIRASLGGNKRHPRAEEF